MQRQLKQIMRLLKSCRVRFTFEQKIVSNAHWRVWCAGRCVGASYFLLCACASFTWPWEAEIFYLSFSLKRHWNVWEVGLKWGSGTAGRVQRRSEHNQKCAGWLFLSGRATATAANRAWGVWVPAPHQLNIWCGRPWLVSVGEGQDPEM